MSEQPASAARATSEDLDRDAAKLRYAGLATRAIAFALDAAVLNLVAIIVGVGAALILSILHLPKEVKTVLAAIGAGVYVLWDIGYFVAFWSTTGQTPGARVMRVQVVSSNGKPIKPRRALLRVIGVVVGAIPLFLGYAMVLFDGRRRAFSDSLARTLVVDAPQESVAATLRARRKAKRAAGNEPLARSA